MSREMRRAAGYGGIVIGATTKWRQILQRTMTRGNVQLDMSLQLTGRGRRALVPCACGEPNQKVEIKNFKTKHDIIPVPYRHVRPEATHTSTDFAR